ncbi:MAG: VWA domain-containing protein, partial [Candidatus Thermoplasmatota archaeon]|nr:VWA domain-containing protein [Candidatus Thermoplasmatota archaeon]
MVQKGEVKKLVEGLLKKRPRRVVNVPVRGGRRSEILTVGKQGRYVKYRTPQGDTVSDIAVLPTIMSAIMHSKGGKVEVKKRDYKEKVRRKKTSSLIPLIIDASSSMVSYRKMEAMQAVLEELLLDAYQKRDRIALIACQGSDARVVLPFTTGVERGKKLLAKMPFGGTTPLSKGIKLGLKTLLEKKAAEPAASSLMIVISDGEANTPDLVGDDVEHELTNIAKDIKERGLNIIFVDVSPEGSKQLEDMAAVSGGKYFHAVVLRHTKLIDPGQYADVDTIVSNMSLAIANPGIKGVFLEKFSDDVLNYALERLRSSLMEMDVVEGCPFNCSPQETENYCYYCELQHDSGEIVATAEGLPIIKLPEGIEPEELWGEVYVHYLVRGGLLQAANRGIVFIPDIANVSADVARSLAEALTDGFVIVEGNGSSVIYPARFTLLAAGDRSKMPPELEPFFMLRVDREDVAPLEAKTREILYQKMFDTDPAQFENQMHKQWQEVLATASKNRSLAPKILLRDRELGICRRLDEGIPALGLVTDIKELSKAFCILEGENRVKDHHIHKAAHLAARFLGEASRMEIRSPVSDFADIAESNVVKDQLILPFINRSDLKLILVEGFDSNVVSGATQFIKYLMLKMQCVEGCAYNDDPHLPETWCRECRLRHEPRNPPVEEREVPIVQVAHETTLEELKGHLFLARVIAYNIFSFAHRGIIFVENIDLMEDESAEAIADVLKRGENIVTNMEYSESHGARFPVIGTMSRQGAELNPLLLEQSTMVIRADHHDWLEMHLQAYEYEQDFGEDPNGIVQAVSVARETAKFQLAHAREILANVQISDSEMDLITRICLELGSSGNHTETKMAAVARTLASYEGLEKVDKSHVLNAAKLVLPLQLLVGEASEDDVKEGEVAEFA